MANPLDWLGKGLEAVAEGVRGSQMYDKYGPDWRERLAFEQFQREQAREEADRRRRSAVIAEEEARQGLSDQLAKAVAAMMEGQAETPSAGQINIGGYDVNLPTAGAVPPDYREAIPKSALEAAGRRAEDIVSAGRGKLAGSRRQLQMLRGEQQGGLQKGRQVFQRSERKESEQFKAGEGQKNRLWRSRERETASAAAERRSRVARETGALRQSLRDVDAEERRALRDFQTGKIDEREYQRRVTDARMSMPSPFDGGAAGPAAPGVHRMPNGELMADADMPAAPAAKAAPAKDPGRPIKYRGQVVPFSSLPPELQRKVEQLEAAQGQ